jgi:hypothetical protein
MLCSSPPQKGVNHALTNSKPSAGGLPGAQDISAIALVAKLANVNSSATSPHERQVPCTQAALGRMMILELLLMQLNRTPHEPPREHHIQRDHAGAPDKLGKAGTQQAS